MKQLVSVKAYDSGPEEEPPTAGRPPSHFNVNRVLRSALEDASMPTFPEWWNWDLSFTSHAELRMEQRGVTEVEVRAMLEQATAFKPNIVEGRFMIHVGQLQHPWVVIVEPDADANLLVVVTVYEVSE